MLQKFVAAPINEKQKKDLHRVMRRGKITDVQVRGGSAAAPVASERIAVNGSDGRRTWKTEDTEV